MITPEQFASAVALLWRSAMRNQNRIATDAEIDQAAEMARGYIETVRRFMFIAGYGEGHDDGKNGHPYMPTTARNRWEEKQRR
jgi:hypothetical protein